MTTHNAGAALDGTLEALGRVMQHGDRLIAIDTGSTDGTLARLHAFSDVVGCDIIPLATPALHDGEALALAIDSALNVGTDAARPPYLMVLGPRDRLVPDVVEQLRIRLKNEQPDLAVFNSGWWHGTALRSVDRLDAARAAALPAHVAQADLFRLCPDPRRCVVAREIWQNQCALLNAAKTPSALYRALIAQYDKLAFLGHAMVLHPQDPTDPTLMIQDAQAHVTSLPRAAQSAALRDVMIWVDEAAQRTSVECADVLIHQIETFARHMPRRLRKQLRTHNGPAGALFDAHWHSGKQGALLRFALTALAAQHHQNEALVADYTQLQQDLQTALPGPQYLRDLYDRVRDL